MNARSRPLLFLLPLLLSCQAAMADRQISESADVHPQGEVEISNVSGRIEVEGWDQGRVEVSGTLGRGAERLEFRVQDRHTLIRVEHPSGSNRVGASNLHVRVPLDSRLVIAGVAGNIIVRGVRGAQRLHSVSGNIDTMMFSDDVQLRTVSGDILLVGEGTPGLATVTTVSGNAELRDVAGELVLQTVSGDVKVASERLERARIRTTSGSAELRSSLSPGARVEMEAVNGTLRLLLNDEPDAEFRLATFNGRIDNSFGPAPARTSRYAPGMELRFTAGEGSARVDMETLNGAIILRTD
jgi:DUF4097 and DUF4098 domain-containing protein YvlB